MKKKIQLVSSGITIVDNAWGGFYRGGTYLLIGPRKSGRTLLGLQFAKECIKQKEVCLYFTSVRPKDLMIQAASIDFDLQHYMNQNQVIVVRVAPPTDLQEVENTDEFLVEYLRDIVTVVEQYQPNKMIFDELTPFINFVNLTLLQDVFIETTEAIENDSITSLFILGDPATPAANSIADTLALNSTGILYLSKEEQAEGTSGGKITITPNIGHTQGKFSANYHLEPDKGIIDDYAGKKKKTGSTAVTESGLQYQSLAELDIPAENYSFTNFYNLNDFQLILNNQIALYRSTGQVFTLVSFRLDPESEKQGLLTINQLMNTIRLSADKKDKICLISNNVVVMVTKEDTKTIGKFISRIQGNLPGTEPEYIEKVIPLISVLALRVDETIKNAEDMINRIILNSHTHRQLFL
ncbi:MAG TPA: RAD55 family ATPase [Ignavibacteriaceae bacterium]|jgi:KaiC/GvpD/RAD55 family RecA-like ATPase|nr:RAD55 family ATPase [Ignavibacteriaceae bacterium]